MSKVVSCLNIAYCSSGLSWHSREDRERECVEGYSFGRARHIAQIGERAIAVLREYGLGKWRYNNAAT